MRSNDRNSALPATSARLARGLAVSVLAAVATWLLVEGAHSLWRRSSLLDRLLGLELRSVAARARPDRDELAGLTAGPYALDRDPEVGFRLKARASPSFVEAPARTDAYGQRVRTGPAPEPDATHVVVLGDSVAFGFGVADEQCTASVVEELLAGARRDGAARAVVSTVACPGWNQASSFRYLRNHLDRLQPDVVLYVAVANDLDDPKSVGELGWHVLDADPRDDRPQCSSEQQERLIQTLQHQPSRAALLEVVQAGGPRRVLEPALRSGLTPESERRWAAFLDAIAALHADLERRGARFAVVLPFDLEFYRQLEVRLATQHPQVPQLGLIAGWSREDSLGTDPHSNPACVRAGAWSIAGFLLDRAWVDGDAARLPPQVEAYRERAFRPLAPEERAPFLDGMRAGFERFLGPAIDLREVRGIHQVYGGLLGDGTVGKHVYVALRGSGTRLTITLERLPAPSAVYPLEITVEVLGRSLGSFAVPPPDEAGPEHTLEVALPPDLGDQELLDVLLRSSSWIETRDELGTHLRSYRLVRLALSGP